MGQVVPDSNRKSVPTPSPPPHTHKKIVNPKLSLKLIHFKPNPKIKKKSIFYYNHWKIDYNYTSNINSSFFVKMRIYTLSNIQIYSFFLIKNIQDFLLKNWVNRNLHPKESKSNRNSSKPENFKDNPTCKEKY